MFAKFAVFLGLAVLAETLKFSKPHHAKHANDEFGADLMPAGQAENMWASFMGPAIDAATFTGPSVSISMPTPKDFMPNSKGFWNPYAQVKANQDVIRGNVQMAKEMASATRDITAANMDMMSASQEYMDNYHDTAMEMQKATMAATVDSMDMQKAGMEMQKAYYDGATKVNAEITNQALQHLSDSMEGETMDDSFDGGGSIGASASNFLYKVKMVLLGLASSIAMALTTMMMGFGAMITGTIAYVTASIAGLFSLGVYTQKSMDIHANKDYGPGHSRLGEQAYNPRAGPGQFERAFAQAAPWGAVPMAPSDPSGFLQVSQSQDGDLKTIRKH